MSGTEVEGGNPSRGNGRGRRRQKRRGSIPFPGQERPSEDESSMRGDDRSGRGPILGAPTLDTLPGEPIVLPRDQHCISRKHIDPDAMKVMGRLLRHGYRAFLVGGGVRDLLLGKTPKDFDIGTDARPETVRSLFRNSRIIGRRFRINHVFFAGNKNFEVSTFRDIQQSDPESESLLITSDNTWGDPQTDALRRDLTINGLFYDLSSFSVIDYVGGVADLNAGIIRTIGDPYVRFEEDPVRMIRAIRHAARTGFTIEGRTFDAICDCKQLISMSAPARVFEELLRELRGGHALRSFALMIETGLLEHLIPPLHQSLREYGAIGRERLNRVLSRIDERVRSGEELSPAHVFLAIFIGNLPSTLFPETGEEGNESGKRNSWDPRLLALWSEPPDIFDGDAFAPSADEELPQPERRGPQGRRMRGRRGPVRSSETQRFIDVVFRGIGVFRKDRERMEDLLLGRYQLYSLYSEGDRDRSVYSRSRFPDWLTLLMLASHSEETDRAIAFWDNSGPVPEGPADDGSAEGGRRRRRRPRRRRGSGNGAPSNASPDGGDDDGGEER